MPMTLYPCVLLGDFGTARLADTITTEQTNRWSTSDATNFNLALSRAQATNDRKSLRIATTASTASGDNAMYGVSGTDLAVTDVMNAFGDDVEVRRRQHRAVRLSGDGCLQRVVVLLHQHLPRLPIHPQQDERRLHSHQRHRVVLHLVHTHRLELVAGEGQHRG